METKIFTSYDGKNLSCSVWDDVKEPIGIVQIFHGMAEHSKRYNEFAEFLNKNGIIVFADDHRAHGLTMERPNWDDGDLFNETIRDEIEITKYLKNTYHLPVIVFGHSYGSFLCQGYIQRNALNVSGAVLCGSSNMDNAITKIGATIASMDYSMSKDKAKPATQLNKIVFGGYDKPFKSENQEFAWLSRNKDNVKAYIADEYSGNVMSVAFFKYMINGCKNLYKKENLEKIPKDLPLRIMSGACDPVGGKDSKDVKKLNQMYLDLGLTNVEFQLYENDRHEILNEVDRDVVYKDTLAFFNRVFDTCDKKAYKVPQNKSKKKMKRQQANKAK